MATTAGHPTPTPDPSGQAVARPLSVLVPLIQEDLARGREAAERAALPYYVAAGEKLLEAKAQVKHGEFQSWVQRNFPVSVRMTRHYMKLAETTAQQKGNALPFSSLREFIRETSKPTGPSAGRQDRQARLRLDKFERACELKKDKQLAIEIIDVGVKALARERHPDKGGSPRDMVRLNRVRAAMKRSLVESLYLVFALERH